MFGECVGRMESGWNISALCSLVVLSISSTEVIYRVKNELPGSIDCDKTKLLRINKKSDNRFKMKEDNIKEVHKFSYFGRVVTNTSGVQDVEVHIHNINTAYIQLYQSWNARENSTATKVKIFRKNIKYDHLWG